VPIGSKKVVVSVPLGNSSMVLATGQQKGRAAVASAVPNPSADTFTISLTRKATKAVVVVWFVLGVGVPHERTPVWPFHRVGRYTRAAIRPSRGKVPR